MTVPGGLEDPGLLHGVEQGEALHSVKPIQVSEESSLFLGGREFIRLMETIYSSANLGREKWNVLQGYALSTEQYVERVALFKREERDLLFEKSVVPSEVSTGHHSGAHSVGHAPHGLVHNWTESERHHVAGRVLREPFA